jgi:hypothetical protein
MLSAPAAAAAVCDSIEAKEKDKERCYNNTRIGKI